MTDRKTETRVRVPGRPSSPDLLCCARKSRKTRIRIGRSPPCRDRTSMQFRRCRPVELLKNRDNRLPADVIPDYEKGQSNKSDTADGQGRNASPSLT